jgi:glutathione synthase/RimK-type ligase-like ATP-grasp enzyme
MILIIADRNDAHANLVQQLLTDDMCKVARLDLDVNSLEKTFITYNGVDWKLKTETQEFISSEITCVWNRKTFVQLMLEEQNKDYKFNIWKNEWNKTLLGLYFSIKDVPWLNYYRANHKAENKYFQMELAKDLGFNMPDCLLTNVKSDFVDFFSKHDKVVLKLMNQDFYKIEENSFKGFYVNILSKEDIADFSEVEENPIFLQEYIEKKFEVRYTVVGEEHFICKIESQKSEFTKVDWRRYDLPNTPHSAIDAPSYIKSAVKELMAKMHLNYGALDFIVTEDDTWYFLEINPSGQYLWIEDLTGLKISNSIKNWLYLRR